MRQDPWSCTLLGGGNVAPRASIRSLLSALRVPVSDIGCRFTVRGLRSGTEAFHRGVVSDMHVTMQDCRNLDVWQRAMYLAEVCYAMTDGSPKREQYGLASQLRRSAVSIPSNIAEGCGRDSPREFARFLRIAYGSGCEVGTQIELARRAGLGDRQHWLLLRPRQSVSGECSPDSLPSSEP